MRPKYGAKRRLCASLTDESGLPCTCLDHLGGAHAEGTVNVGGPDVVAALPEGAAATSAPVRVTVFVRPASVKSAPGSRAAARPRTGTTACRTGAGTWSGLWAADVDAFYAARRPGPSSADVPLVMQYDGKGIVMRPEALRHATAKTAAARRRKLATRLSPGEKHGRKRMAELACACDAIPVPRTPADIIHPPGSPEPRPRSRGPAATGQWLTASVTSDIPAVIAAGFDEAERWDPAHARTWVALVDGNTQPRRCWCPPLATPLAYRP